MRLIVNMVHDRQNGKIDDEGTEIVTDDVDEIIIMHYRKPTEGEGPELVAQYPMHVEGDTSCLLTDVKGGDMLVIA